MKAFEEKDIKILLNRIKNLEDLLVCYRLNKRPSETLLDKLDSSSKKVIRLMEKLNNESI